MANPEHLEVLKQGVKQWNEWREQHPGVEPDLREASLNGADLRKANLGNADLSKASLLGATFRGANLRRADLYRAQLRRADLREADCGEADLSVADLRTGDLSKANLVAASLRQTDLTEAHLGHADLRRVSLFAANLANASLDAADLRGADLTLTDLRSARLHNADLRMARINAAKLRGADFTGARAADTNFSNVDLRPAKGLEAMVHEGPSTVGIDAIYRSQGKIPKEFLRGVGIPEEFIEFIGSMKGRRIDYYSCFISHSTLDQEFAEQLYDELQDKGVRCWYAPHDIKSGRKIHEQIDEAIRTYDKLLLILSEHSMASEWVKEEIARARKREAQEKRQMLFPVALVPYDPVIKDWECFDADRGKDSAREIREYFIPDFSKWKEHDAYQKVLEKLVGDLKAIASG